MPARAPPSGAGTWAPNPKSPPRRCHRHERARFSRWAFRDQLKESLRDEIGNIHAPLDAPSGARRIVQLRRRLRIAGRQQHQATCRRCRARLAPGPRRPPRHCRRRQTMNLDARQRTIARPRHGRRHCRPTTGPRPAMLGDSPSGSGASTILSRTRSATLVAFFFRAPALPTAPRS